MAKIRFSNGVVVNFNGTPTQQDIDEIAKQFAQPEKKGFLSRVGSFVTKDIFGGGDNSQSESGLGQFGKDVFKATVGSQGLAGVAQMPGKTLGQFGLEKDKKAAEESRAGLADQTTALVKLIREIDDPEKKAQLQKQVDSNLQSLGLLQDTSQKLEEKTLTPRDTVSTSANAALTAFTGSGNQVFKAGMTGAKALPVGSKAASTAYRALNYGNKVLPRALEQGVISAGFGMSNNLREDKPIMENAGLNFALGSAFPFAGTATSKAVSKLPEVKLKAAERIVNSLVKPLLKDFSYGKNPGRGVAREGIVFNNLEEGYVKVTERLQSIGKQIDSVSQQHSDEVIDLTTVLNPIDEAIANAKRAPETNANLIGRLNAAKRDLLQVTTNLDGTQEIGLDLANITFKEAVELKRLIGDITKFTGNASDDGAVNAALKRAYGQIKAKLNQIAPEMRTLNERYADLKSAQIAIKYRDKIEARQNLIKFAPKLLGGGLGAVGITTLNPALIAGAFLTYGTDTLLSSPAFKTRLASWLAKSSVKERGELIRNFPGLKNVIDRIFGEKRKPLNKAEIEKLLEDMPAGMSIKDVSGKVKVKVNGKQEIMDVKDYKNWSRKWDEDGTPYEFIERLK